MRKIYVICKNLLFIIFLNKIIKKEVRKENDNIKKTSKYAKTRRVFELGAPKVGK